MVSGSFICSFVFFLLLPLVYLGEWRELRCPMIASSPLCYVPPVRLTDEYWEVFNLWFFFIIPCLMAKLAWVYFDEWFTLVSWLMRNKRKLHSDLTCWCMLFELLLLTVWVGAKSSLSPPSPNQPYLWSTHELSHDVRDFNVLAYRLTPTACTGQAMTTASAPLYSNMLHISRDQLNLLPENPHAQHHVLFLKRQYNSAVDAMEELRSTSSAMSALSALRCDCAVEFARFLPTCSLKVPIKSAV